MFAEYDVVKLKHQVSSGGATSWPGVASTTVEEGALGTVVMVYQGESSDHTYEVEFVADDGSTLALLTLTDADIELPGQRDTGR